MEHERMEWLEVARGIGPRIAERAAAHDAAGTFVADAYALLRERRVMSAMVPVELGGGGAPHREMCAVLRELAHHCGATALSLSMHQHLIATAVWKYRHGQPARALLERVAARELVLVSTGARDWMDSSGTATPVEGGYRISARKPFASGCPAGDVLVTSAAFDDPEAGAQVLHFSVPMSAEGVCIDDDWDALGMRATGSNTVLLEEVFVPAEAISLRRPRGAYHPAFSVILTAALPLITSVYVGIAEEAAAIARRHAQRRPADPVAPALLGELVDELTTAQLAADDMVELAGDLDVEPTVELADAMLVRKTIATTAALATAEKALELAGGAGFGRRSGLERLLRDAHAGQFHPLPPERQRRFTGRLALGLDPIG